VLNEPYVVDEFPNVCRAVKVLAVYVFGIVVDELMNELIVSVDPTHVPFTAKQPPVIFHPTLDVDVALPEMFRPERVVVPKPSDDTESCVAVDEPTTNPSVSPATGLTDSLAVGVDDETPTVPFELIVVVAVPPKYAVYAESCVVDDLVN